MTGDYEVDDFGYDPDFTDHVLVPPLKVLYEKWFRIETLGMENIPDTGGALLVANHSGTIAVDALMTAVAVREHHPQKRPLRMLGADLVFQTPFLGPISRKAGNTLACNPDAERLLSIRASWSRCSRRASRASASRTRSGTSCSGSVAAGSSPPR